MSGWELGEGTLHMEVEIPSNTSATLYIPGEAVNVVVNGQPLESSGMEYMCADGEVVVPVGSGQYAIIAGQ